MCQLHEFAKFPLKIRSSSVDLFLRFFLGGLSHLGDRASGNCTLLQFLEAEARSKTRTSLSQVRTPYEGCFAIVQETFSVA